jgi:hypothetical protein
LVAIRPPSVSLIGGGPRHSELDEVNAVIKSTAAKTGSAYVDLRAAFKSPNYAYDETHYLSNDGDHPNAAGQLQPRQVYTSPHG